MIIGNYSVICVLAESIRQEVGNRSTIVGTYTRNIAIAPGPGSTMVPMAFFLTIQPVPPEGTSSVCYVNLNDEALTEIPVQSAGGGEDALSALYLSVNGSPLSVKDGDRYTVSLSIGDLDRVTVAEAVFEASNDNADPA